MDDHIHSLFPGWQREFRLLADNVAFQEACDDYEELATWLALAKDRSVPSQELQEARDLLHTLETEIVRALKSARDHPP